MDVFFVLSGYLISGIILRGLEQGKFSLGDFYVRRINRILPALVVVLCATFALGWLFMFAPEFHALGQHVIGGSTFSSNFLLAKKTSYFDSPALPLLHLWSLAVEEQFYLLWPATLLVLWKTKLNIRWSLIAIIVCSLAANVWFVWHGRALAAFYMPSTRFWEILAGSLLIQVERSHDGFGGLWREMSEHRSELLSIAGALLLVLSFSVALPEKEWLGLKGLLPVTGTVLLVAAGPHAWINRKVLSAPSVVMIGLISYPLYLWHWPLLVFGKLVNEHEPRPLARAMIVCAALVLADATYRFVEQPVRFGRHKRRSAIRLVPGLVATAALGMIAYFGVIGTRLEDSQPHVIARWGPNWDGPETKIFDTLDFHFYGTKAKDTATVVFYGDSHVGQYWGRVLALGLDSVQKSPRVMLISRGGCPPLPETNLRGVDWEGNVWNCDVFNRVAVAYMKRPRVKTIVIGAFWEHYAVNGLTFLVTDPSSAPFSDNDPNAIKAYDLLGDEIAAFVRAGKTVYIILPNPTADGRLAGSGLPLRLGGFGLTSKFPAVPLQQFLSRAGWTIAQLRRIAERSGAHIIDPVQFLCGPVSCPLVTADGEPIFTDDNHLRAGFIVRHAAFIDQVFSH